MLIKSNLPFCNDFFSVFQIFFKGFFYLPSGALNQADNPK